MSPCTFVRTVTHWQRQAIALFLVGISILLVACGVSSTSGGGPTVGPTAIPIVVHTGYQLQTYSTVVRGDTKWAIILCKFADHSEEPHPISFYQQFMTEAGAGMGGLYDFYHDISYGNINLSGSVVKGWFTETNTLAQEQPKSRWDRISDCVNTAQSAATNPFTVPSDFHIVVMLNAQVDAGSAGGRVELDPGAQFVAFAAHEMGHGYGAVHSFSNDNYQNATWSAPGEYGNLWDVMSVQHVFWYATPNFGSGGPGMDGYYLDKLGWLPYTRILTFGADGATNTTLTLAALNAPGASGSLMIRIPFDPGDLYHYYTVELRHKSGWDQGIPRNTVLINEIRDNGTSYLINTNESPTYSSSTRYEWEPGMTFTDATNQVSVAINSIDTTAGTASVTIQSAIATRCVQGYVWREAYAGDHVCVTPDERSQAASDNAQAANRIDPHGAYGPDSCIQGYVWREANPTDHVCVTPDQRTQVANDNSQAAQRINPAQNVYGPHTCVNGYVWRQADIYDYVCATPDQRTQAANDNAQAASRVNPSGAYGPNTCMSGYVWREAFPDDFTCVTPAERAQATADNGQADSRVAHP